MLVYNVGAFCKTHCKMQCSGKAHQQHPATSATFSGVVPLLRSSTSAMCNHVCTLGDRPNDVPGRSHVSQTSCQPSVMTARSQNFAKHVRWGSSPFRPTISLEQPSICRLVRGNFGPDLHKAHASRFLSKADHDWPSCLRHPRGCHMKRPSGSRP